MKYIRTKDNVYVLSEVYWAVIEDDILVEADTIEKLCDGVIEKCLSGNRFCPIETFNKQEAIKCMNIDVNKGYKEFYYGIFVEHNNKIDFISVAKMNDKGELELI